MFGRISATLDNIAAVLLAVVAALTFSEAALRWIFGTTIPDAFTLVCMAQGIAMLWGIASTTYDGKHIVVDALWEASSPRVRRWIDVFADGFTAAFFILFAWMLARKVGATQAAHDATTELGLPVWPFYLTAWLGVVAAAVLALMRVYRMTSPRPIDG